MGALVYYTISQESEFSPDEVKNSLWKTTDRYEDVRRSFFAL